MDEQLKDFIAKNPNESARLISHGVEVGKEHAIPSSSTRLTMAVGHGVTSTVARQIDLDYLALLS